MRQLDGYLHLGKKHAMKTGNSFWNITAASAPHLPWLDGDFACDVAVIGGGNTGLRAALKLAEAGSDVAVLEAGDVAHGASGLSGGQVNPMLPVGRPDELRRDVGDVFFERMAEAAINSADELFDLVETYQLECQARQNGWVRADHCEEARILSRENAQLWNNLGADFEFAEHSDVERLTGARRYASGTISKRGGAVQPLALTRELARVACAAGARVYRNSPVRGLSKADGRWILQVNGQRVTAERVIIATNAYTDSLVPGLRHSLLPLASIQIATKPLENNQLAKLCPQGHTISDTRRVQMYARREPGGQFIFGGMGYRSPMGGLRGFRWLKKDVQRIFPSLRGAKFSYKWGGTIAFTRDRVPHLHEPDSGLIAGLGYNGRGIAMSLVMGDQLARRALGLAPEHLIFPPAPAKPYPFRTSQLLGAGFAMSYWRYLDRRDVARG